MIHVKRIDENQSSSVTKITSELEIDMSRVLDSGIPPSSVLSSGLDGGTEYFSYSKLWLY
jgi:hypothetical protein